jgi:putative heme-binding domain-containing protein
MWAIRVSTLTLAGALAGGALLAQQTGDSASGKLIFEGKGTCTSCHRIKGTGSHFGPDLSEIGARTPEQLRTSILDPDAEILPANRIYRVVSKNGTTTIGRLLNEDTFTVQMIDKSERLLSFQKADLREYAFETKSPMPSFKDKLSDQEIADVVAYLGTFKPPPGAGRGGRGGLPAGAPPAPPAGAPPATGAPPAAEPH